jgi:CheY-like chemotaxis protein
MMATDPVRRALVVDDGPMNRRLLTGLLDQLGWASDTASSGEEGLSKCGLSDYDVVFVDLHMPGLGGREMVELLREAERQRGAPRMRVIVLTADDAPPLGDQGWFDVFLSKPITSALIEESFATIVSGAAVPLPPTERPVDLVDEFLAATSEALDRMKGSLEVGDFAAIAHDAHGLKGTGTSFGFSLMSAVGSRLEQQAMARSRAGVERGLLDLERRLSCA